MKEEEGKTTKRRLVLGSGHIATLKKLAADSLPLESCALLVGRVVVEKEEGGASFIVSGVIVARNADSSRTSFSIEAGELLDAYRKAEEMGMDIVGIFHSHPAPALPSSNDLRFMEINPVPWLIMSTTDSEMRAFILDGGEKMEELEIAVPRE